jgi:hypothetical protein
MQPANVAFDNQVCFSGKASNAGLDKAMLKSENQEAQDSRLLYDLTALR